MTDLFHHLASVFCHQDAGRMAVIDHLSIGLCWRCTGLHIAFVMSWMIGSYCNTPVAHRYTRWSWLLLTGPALMVVHWYAGAYMEYDASSTELCLAGVVGGAGYGTWMALQALHLRVSRMVRTLPHVVFVMTLAVMIVLEVRELTTTMLAVTTIHAASVTTVTVIMLGIIVMTPKHIVAGFRQVSRY